MDGSIAWEHKMLNNDIRAALDTDEATGADLPPLYRVQMEQQCMVSKCERVLFTATRYSPAGELLEERHCWYEPDPALAEQIRAGWAQLEADVAAYKPEADVVEVKAVPRVIEALPALVAQVEGRVVTTNLQDFRLAASRFIEGIKTDLQTDQDFADAEKTVKFCEDGEKRLDVALEQIMAQTGSIDELRRTVQAIKEELRSKRLSLSKLVDQRKVSIRTEIATKAQADMDSHWAAVGERLPEAWIKRAVPDFPGAMKGKRSIETCRAAVDQTLANAKIEMTQLADRLLANRETLKREGTDWLFLFADFAQVGAKAPEDFRAVAELRIRDHLAAQERAATERRERINTRIEELRQARTAHVGVVAISQALVRIRANVPSTDLYGDRLEKPLRQDGEDRFGARPCGIKLSDACFSIVLGLARIPLRAPHLAVEVHAVQVAAGAVVLDHADELLERLVAQILDVEPRAVACLQRGDQRLTVHGDAADDLGCFLGGEGDAVPVVGTWERRHR